MALKAHGCGDNLSARFDGDAVVRPRRSGHADQLVLCGHPSYGGVGNDQLATYYDLALVPDVDEFRIRVLAGWRARERQNACLAIWPARSQFSPWIYASVNLTGGDGLDEISVNLLSSDGFFETSNISAGAGDDVITVSEDVRRSNISTMEK